MNNNELPKDTISFDEKTGIKTRITWRYKNPVLKNELIKTTIRSRVFQKITRKTSKRINHRKNMILNKFGACKDKPPGIEKNVTFVSTEPIKFESLDELKNQKNSIFQEEIKQDTRKTGLYIPPALRVRTLQDKQGQDKQGQE